MLLELYIENFAIIEKLQIHFEKKLNVITGETGSGKSIIIEALDLLCGQRFHKRFVRNPSKPTVVEGVFALSDKDAARFTEAGYFPEEGQIIITRMIDHHKTMNRINGRVVNLSTLSSLMRYLMDIHGQNSSTSLLRKESYLQLMDRFCQKETSRLKSDIKKHLESYHSFQQRYQALDMDESEKDREIDILTFQIKEIEDLDLNNIDESLLMRQYEELSNIQEIREKLHEIQSVYQNDTDSMAMCDAMEFIRRKLEQVSQYSQTLHTLKERYETLYYEWEDIFSELKSYSQTLDEDPERLFQLNQTIEKLTQLKRKYGNHISDILAFKDQAEQKRTALYELEKHQIFLKNEMENILKKSTDLAKKLTRIRKEIAGRLEKSIEKNLKDLNMVHAKFKVDLKPLDRIRENGMDDVDFLISTNPGQPLKPLADIASGGEISRIMLGFKSTFAEIDNINTLIFDEIDTGISGRTAQVVGEKMLEIATNRQVICISHLPQIAALSDHHLLITKEQKEEETLSNVISIDNEHKVNELSRMIGGVNITETTRRQAAEMLEQAEVLKKGRCHGKQREND